MVPDFNQGLDAVARICIRFYSVYDHFGSVAKQSAENSGYSHPIKHFTLDNVLSVTNYVLVSKFLRSDMAYRIW
jgi:hypothetical protein